METTETTIRTFEISIPEKYVSAIRTLIKSMGGKIKAHKERKTGLDEAIEDIKAGRISKTYASVDEMWEDLMK